MEIPKGTRIPGTPGSPPPTQAGTLAGVNAGLTSEEKVESARGARSILGSLVREDGYLFVVVWMV